MRAWAAAAATLLGLTLAACTGAPEVACTLIGASSGVALTVPAPYAARVDRVSLTVCWTDPCTEGRVDLVPGSDTVDQGCSGPDPDDTCSATAVPNGSRTGFLDVPGLPAGDVRLSGSARVDGRVVALEEVTRTAATTYPNGPRCPPGANQVSVRLTESGLA